MVGVMLGLVCASVNAQSLSGSISKGCGDISLVSSANTPVDLIGSSVQCIKEGEYEKAVEWYIVSGAFAKFDKYRVTDESAHSVYSALTVTMEDGLTSQQAEAFDEKLAWVVSEHLSGNTLQQDKICNALQKLETPLYRPTYMINHGMSAFMGKKSFDETKDYTAEWKMVLKDYMHCAEQ